MHSLTCVEYLGNTIFFGSVTSILIGLIQGGIVHPWGSLVIGLVGWTMYFV